MSHLLSIIYLPAAVDLTRCSWLTHEEKSDKQFEWHTDANWSIDSLIRRWIHLCIHTVGHHREDAVMTGSSSEVDMNNVLMETVVFVWLMCNCQIVLPCSLTSTLLWDSYAHPYRVRYMTGCLECSRHLFSPKRLVSLCADGTVMDNRRSEGFRVQLLLN